MLPAVSGARAACEFTPVRARVCVFACSSDGVVCGMEIIIRLGGRLSGGRMVRS